MSTYHVCLIRPVPFLSVCLSGSVPCLSRSLHVSLALYLCRLAVCLPTRLFNTKNKYNACSISSKQTAEGVCEQTARRSLPLRNTTRHAQMPAAISLINAVRRSLKVSDTSIPGQQTSIPFTMQSDAWEPRKFNVTTICFPGQT